MDKCVRARISALPQVIFDKDIVEKFTPSAPWEPKPAAAPTAPPAAPPAAAPAAAPSPLKRLSSASGASTASAGSSASEAAQADLFVRQRKASHAIGEISNTWDVRCGFPEELAENPPL